MWVVASSSMVGTEDSAMPELVDSARGRGTALMMSDEDRENQETKEMGRVRYCDNSREV